jgi:hypothetical protein
VGVAPEAPSGLTLTQVIAGTTITVRLNWNDNSLNATSFTVQRATNAAFTANLQTFAVTKAPGMAQTFTDTPVVAGTSYRYRVFANNLVGSLVVGFPSATAQSAASNVALITVLSPPAAPTGLTATVFLSPLPFHVNLAWNAVTGATGGYIIERATGICGTLTWAQIGTTASGTTTFSDTTVTANLSYSYRVRAVNAAGSGNASNVATAVVATARPAAPSGMALVSRTATSINFSWVNNATNQSGFIIERQSIIGGVASGWVQIAVVNNPCATTYNATGLTSSTNYQFRVAATNAIGRSLAYAPFLNTFTLP